MTKDTDKSSWGFKLYYLLFVLAGLAFAVYVVHDFPQNHWHDIFLFVCLIILADSAQISLPRGGASIYASSPIDLAGIVLFGPAVMAVIEGIATIITEGILQRRPFMKLIFNVPLLMMTVGVSGLVYKAFGSLGDIGTPAFLIPLTAAGVVYYLFNTWAVSFVIALSDRRNPVHVWKQNYMWNFFHILAFLPVGAIIALLYAHSGVWTIALFIIPLFLARYSFQLYLDMREAHINTVAALTSAIDASDPFTHGHSFRVSRYALRIARAMGSRRATSRCSNTRGSSTTSGRSRSRTTFSSRSARSPMRNGARSSRIPASAPISSSSSSSSRRPPRSSGATTNARTATDTRAASRGTRFRSRPASSTSSTPSTR